MTNQNFIKIRGAKVHNLKNIDLDIPKNKLVVMTGVSGSGKSSLAFDTLYAEGQRRYVESLSSYARQFLGILQKPDVESIEGLSPAISIDQKSTSHNPRSTVGTITEISDYLRLLFARIGTPYCTDCGTVISQMSIDEITEIIKEKIISHSSKNKLAPSKYFVISPIVRGKKGEFSELFDSLRQKGFREVLVDGKQYSLDRDFILIKTNKHSISVIVDEINISHLQAKDTQFIETMRGRIFLAIEQSTQLSTGLVELNDKDGYLQEIYSLNYACPKCGKSLSEIEPRMFSFNSPIGACMGCHGLGYITNFDARLILNKSLSLAQGAILPLFRLGMTDTWFGRLFNTMLVDADIDPKIPLEEISEDKLAVLLYGNEKTYRVKGKNRHGDDTSIFESWEGIVPILQKKYTESDSEWVKSELEKYMNKEICGECSGKRLKPEVLNIKIVDKNIFDIGELPIDELLVQITNLTNQISSFQNQIAAPILREIIARAGFLVNVGLGYLNLNRNGNTLSGGEAQRIRLASQIGSGLTGVMYVLDEPSIGLHPKDVAALIKSLTYLRDLGNSVIVVEHDPETIQAADHLIDFGPFAGNRGGEVVFSGSYDQLKNSNTLTAKYMFHEDIVTKIKNNATSEKNDSGKIKIKGCSENNLKNIDVEFPLSKLITVTGVSGSGKSSLVIDTLYPALKYHLTGTGSGNMGDFRALEGFEYVDSVYLVDQSAIGRTPRSNPATYIGLFDLIRDIFANTTDAKMKGYKKGRFSFNVKGGRCEKCSGGGVIKIEMQFLADIYVNCDSCDGKRYNSETLDVKYKGKNIEEVLNMTVEDALEFFSVFSLIKKKLQTLQEIGLGYLKLGQTAPTLSGGEAQRVKVAHELSKKDSGRSVYILDEPTTGLHLYDVEKMLLALRELVNRGNTVIVIEHNLDVVASSDHIIDMGPNGGDGGGEKIFEGIVDDLRKAKNSYTGQYLNTYKPL